MTQSSEANQTNESVASEPSSPWKQRMRFTFPSGATPLGGYTIKRGLGIGGFGEVYFAVSDSGKEVALKRIARNLDVELRGVRQCLNLKHANLIGLWDIQVDDHHENWVVMEYVSGPSLRDVLQANPNGLPMDDVIWWFQGITAGVHYLHQNGIVHRDLKPGNIFHDNEAQLVKIGDYGLSKFISCSRRSGHTESVGTVHYMAPEIGRGIYGREIDVYSLGIVLFELLTGKVPFHGECSQEIIMKHLTADPDVSVLSAPFDHVVRKALLKDPEQRYSTVLEMIADLPKDFWPAALRRSVMQLQDTGKHEFPSLDTTNQSPAADDAKDAQKSGPNNREEETNREIAAEQSTRERKSQSSIPRSLGSVLPPSQMGGASNSNASSASPLPMGSSGRSHRLVSNSQFNVPPAPARSSLHSVTQQAGIYYGDEVNHRSSQGNSSETDVVFGDVQFHDIVEAEVVETPAPAAPQKFKPGADQIAEDQAKVTTREKANWLKSGRYVLAAERFLHQLSGSDRLSSLLQGFLVSSLIMFASSVLLAMMIGTDLSSASNVDNLFAFCVWFGLVGTFGSWLVLAMGMLWAPAVKTTWLKVISLIPASVALAGLAYTASMLGDVYFVPFAGDNLLLIRGYLGTLLSFAGVPQSLGYFLFFMLAGAISRWWTQTSPIRVHWLSVFPVIRGFLAGLVGSLLLGTGYVVPAMLCAGMSVAIQCGAPYFNDQQRLEIRRTQMSA